MKKQQTEDEKKALSEARQKARAARCGIICIIDNAITISVDQYNYVLKISGARTSYFPCIEMVIEAILDDKVKRECVKNRKKDLVSLRNAIIRSQKWMEEVVNPMLDMNVKQK